MKAIDKLDYFNNLNKTNSRIDPVVYNISSGITAHKITVKLKDSQKRDDGRYVFSVCGEKRISDKQTVSWFMLKESDLIDSVSLDEVESFELGCLKAQVIKND